MTRVVSTDETSADDAAAAARSATRPEAWTSAPPADVARLAGGLTSASHLADWAEGRDYEHAIRIYDDILESITDASSAAARAGHAAWALAVIDAAATRPPVWAGGFARGFWDRLLSAGRDAVLSSLSA